MSEPHSVDHWAALAGDLGAQPAPETTQPPVASDATSTESPTAAAPPAPIFQAPSKSVRPEKKPAKPPAWDQLAGRIGNYAPMPPPAPPAAPAPKSWEEPKSRIPAPPAPVAERAASYEPAELAAEIEIEAELTAWNDMEPTATEPHSFEPQEALDFMDDTSEEFSDEYSDELSGEPSEEPAATTEASGEAAPAEGDERRGRRRRRRRGRGRGRDRETAGAPGSVAGEADEAGPAESFEEGEGAFEEVEGGFDEGVESESSGGGELTPKRPEGDRGPRAGGSRRRGRGYGREPVRDEAAAPGRGDSSRAIRLSLPRPSPTTRKTMFTPTASLKTSMATRMTRAVNRRASVSATFLPGKMPSA